MAIFEDAINLFNQLKAKMSHVELMKIDYFDTFHKLVLPKYIPNCGDNKEAVIFIYKKLLTEIKTNHQDIYIKMHKGTAFYFIEWYSFLLKNYDQSVFYLDAAISEDKETHKAGDLWKRSGAAAFFLLNSNYTGHYEKYSTSIPHDLVNEEINNFNTVFHENISVNSFVSEFVEKMLVEENTAIITTLYTFILESKDISEMIELRSIHGGTIEPMVIHLFKGSIIFETLLKKTNKRPDGTDYTQLSGIFDKDGDKGSPFPSKYPEFQMVGGHVDKISDIIQSLNEGNYKNNISSAFNTVYKLRNSTAHKLSWDDIFNKDNYIMLYNQVILAILYVIYKEYDLK